MESDEKRGRLYLSNLLDEAVRLRSASALEPKVANEKALRAHLQAAADWLGVVLAGQEHLSPELAAYRQRISELSASAEARLLDFRQEPASRSALSRRLDPDIARTREVLESYDARVRAEAGHT